MGNVIRLDDTERVWNQIKKDIDDGEADIVSGLFRLCDAGEMLRQERATMSAETFVQDTARRLSKTKRYCYDLMNLSFYRHEIGECSGIEEAKAIVKALPPSDEEKAEKASWPSERGKQGAGGRPKGTAKKKQTAKPAPKLRSTRSLLTIAFPNLSVDMATRTDRGCLRFEINAIYEEKYSSKIPDKVEIGSEVESRILETCKTVYQAHYGTDPEPEELTPENLNTLDKFKKKLERDIDYRVHTKVYEFVQENIADLHASVKKLQRSMDSQNPVFTDKEYKLVRGRLHSDALLKHLPPEAVTLVGADAKAKMDAYFNKAFNLLEQNKDRLCGLKPSALEGVSGIPRTPEEFIKRRVKK